MRRKWERCSRRWRFIRLTANRRPDSTDMLDIITSDALAPLRHGFFTRRGGASSGVFQGLNCGTGSSDQAEAVAINRARVADAMEVAPGWLQTVHQVHSPLVVTLTGPLDAQRPEADA